jgi:hypothetical protein
MIRNIVGLLSMLLTFSLGAIPAIYFDKAEQRSSDEIKGLSLELAEREFPFQEEDPRFTKIVESLKEGDYFPWGRACGNGFVTAYITVGRKRLTHSYQSFETKKEARAKFSQELGLAKVLISQPTEVLREGERVTRAFFKGESDEGEYFVINWIGNASDGFTSIVGPTEETTIGLERHILTKK